MGGEIPYAVQEYATLLLGSRLKLQTQGPITQRELLFALEQK